MSQCNECTKTNCREIGIQDVSEIEVDLTPNMPDFLFGINTVLNEATGNVMSKPVRVPGNKVIPRAVGEFPLETNNDDLSVPDQQVIACYILNTGRQNQIVPATNTHEAIFLVSEIDGAVAKCQNTGVLNMPAGHDYNIGMQYYFTDGQISTQPGGQKLFVPISEYQLLINM